MPDNNDMDVGQLTRDNAYLFKLLFLHQVYLEGVRLNYTREFNKVLIKLYSELQKFISELNFTKLDEWTKVEMNKFVRRLSLAQMHLFSRYTQELIGVLQQFLGVDIYGTRLMLAQVMSMSPEDANTQNDHSMTKGIAAVAGTSASNAALWGTIANDPIPANGMTIEQMIKQFGSSAVAQMSRRVRMGYANGWTPQELLTNIAGTKSLNWRDGYFAQLNNQANALIGTALQHVSIVSQSAVMSAYMASYTWVSVMDAVTTKTCWERNGNIYAYGDGPLPPANWNCRSKIVGNIEGADDLDIPTTFMGALGMLSATMLQSLLSSKQVAQFKKGEDITLSDVAKPMNLTEFRNKIKETLGA